jgi:hypothetical protein
VKGTIKSDRNLEFTLKNINGQVSIYFFFAKMDKNKNQIVGNYGFKKDEAEGTFKLCKDCDNPI